MRSLTCVRVLSEGSLLGRGGSCLRALLRRNTYGLSIRGCQGGGIELELFEVMELMRPLYRAGPLAVTVSFLVLSIHQAIPTSYFVQLSYRPRPLAVFSVHLDTTVL